MDRLEVTSHVAARMRQLRQQRGWSALQLANACAQEGLASLTRSTIAKIESGVRQSITAEEIAVLALVFGVTPTDLMGREGDPSVDFVISDSPVDFFISYSPADERWASWIAWQLEAAGHSTVIQAWDFAPGTNFIDFIDRGVRDAAVVVAILSRNYLKSRYGHMEWQAALRTDWNRLIAVRVEDCPLEGLLSTITYVDLVGVTDPGTANDILLSSLRRALPGRAKPARARRSSELGRARRTPVAPPPYPPTGPAPQDRREAIALLHVPGPRFGRGMAEALNAHDLQARIWANVTHLTDTGAPYPDLILVTGDLMESGRPRERDEALEFLIGLRVLLGLQPDRLLIVPGGHDVSKAACLSYFATCEAQEVQPQWPYFPKLQHYERLFTDLYEGLDGPLFDIAQPWTLFAVPELRVAVAGLNSTMAATHREEDDYGWIGDTQAAWFTKQLRRFEESRWLRIGIIRHRPHPSDGPVATDPSLLRDSVTVDRLMGPRLNMLLHGPGPGSATVSFLASGLPVVPATGPGQEEIIEVTRHGLRRYSTFSGTAGEKPLHLAQAWHAVDGTFTPATAGELVPGGGEPGTALERVEPTPAADSLAALLDDPQVPEHKRFCPNPECRQPVGRSSNGRPGRAEGCCPRCGTRFAFRPLLRPGVLVGDGQFKVEGAIAHGGLGWVYRAWDCWVPRWVVLKGLMDRDDPDARQAAMAELAALADTSHPNIVTVLTVVRNPHPLTGRDVDYIVLECLSGKSLKQLYQERPDSDPCLPVDQVCRYGLAVLAALDHLHKRGLLYCDLSADNVIHSTDGVKLIDLGAVRRIDDCDSPVWGKPGYQDPGIATYGPSVATDLYTVARMMALLSFPFPGFSAGEPIPGPDEVELLARYPSFHGLLRRATNPDPQCRFASAADMAEQLKGVLQEVRAQQDSQPLPAEQDAHTNPLSQIRDVKSSLRHVVKEVERRADVEERPLQPSEQYRSRTEVYQSPMGSGKSWSVLGRQPPSGVVVHFQGRQVAVLRPGNPPFTFGRGHDRSLRFGHDCVNGGPDLHISRNVGSIQYDSGLWVVDNESGSRPFDVIVRGVSNPLPPRIASDSYSRWAISPPGLAIRIGAPSGRYLLSISLDNPRLPILDPPGHDDPGTRPLGEPTVHERLLLAAKFLALPDSGDAVGNREAAEYASAARPEEPWVSERAVDSCVVRWCRRLQELGVTGISGRDNINQLGRQLLAWGLLRQEDRRLLRPVARS